MPPQPKQLRCHRWALLSQARRIRYSTAELITRLFDPKITRETGEAIDRCRKCGVMRRVDRVKAVPRNVVSTPYQWVPTPMYSRNGNEWTAEKPECEK